MNKTIYSIAQIQTERENIHANINKHLELINIAARHNSNMIVFPEMSLTGYERELAKKQGFVINDRRLSCLQEASIKNNIIIVAGAPLLIENKLYIASLIFKPNKSCEVYIKKYLHPGEELYYNQSYLYDPIIDLRKDKISFAICYDIERDEHVECVKQRNSNIYAASIFYSEKGIESGRSRLQSIACDNSLTVLMSNYVGNCWNMKAGGKSSVWSREGKLVVSADSHTECMLLAEEKNGEWNGNVINL